MTSIHQQRERTLLIGCLLSAWAPITTGYAAWIGQSVLLLADFLRRTSELVGLLFAWHVSRLVNRGYVVDTSQTLRLEHRSSLVSAIILIGSGIVTGLFTYRRLLEPTTPTGIALGLAVAVAGALVNGGFYLRYRRLVRLQSGPILLAQYNVYRAKTLTDIGVSLMLILSQVGPTPIQPFIDPIGSAAIALLLLVSGYQTFNRSWRGLRSIPLVNQK